LNIEKGFITGLIGENGAGKSSLINLILGLKKADSGVISIFSEQDIETHRDEILNRIGFVFAEDRFPENKTLKGLAKILNQFYTHFDEEAFNHYINKFKIRQNQTIRNFSTGEKMK